jgi:hypothetical protein
LLWRKLVVVSHFAREGDTMLQVARSVNVIWAGAESCREAASLASEKPRLVGDLGFGACEGEFATGGDFVIFDARGDL